MKTSLSLKSTLNLNIKVLNLPHHVVLSLLSLLSVLILYILSVLLVLILALLSVLSVPVTRNLPESFMFWSINPTWVPFYLEASKFVPKCVPFYPNLHQWVIKEACSFISPAAFISFGSKTPGVIKRVQVDWRSQTSTVLPPHTPVSLSTEFNTDTPWIHFYFIYIYSVYIPGPKKNNNKKYLPTFKKGKKGKKNEGKNIHQQFQALNL